MSVVILIALAFIFGLVYLYLKRKYSFWNRLEVSGPKPLYLLGNVKNTIFGKKYIGDDIASIYRDFPNEKIVGIYVTTTPFLLVRDLDIVKHILLKDFVNFSSRGIEFSEEALGTNLFHADEDSWNILRKRMVPFFSSGKTKKMFYLINESADRLTSYIEERIESKEWKIDHLISKYTMSAVGKCIFGFESDWWTDENNIFFEIGDRLFQPSWRVILDMIAPGILKKYNLSFVDMDIVNFFKDLGRKLSAEREGKPKLRHDFIDLMLELKEESNIKGNKVMGIEEISLIFNHNIFSAQILLLFAAGYEATASITAYLLRELSLNPEIQEKIIEEVDRVYKQFDGNLTYEAVGELKYMNMVFYETLRLYSILDPIQRQCKEDYKIPGTDVVLPKGTICFISIEGIHKDPKYWSEPNIFNPERFSPKEKEKGHPMRFLTFGEGPRICIGNRFATVVARLGLAKFFRHYRVEACEQTVGEMRYVARRFVRHPQGGIYVKIVKRHH